ncbi:hypothetical protein BD410DRAFT_840292 [Rickenella mellea]|uniref:Uncharacterized protein n=1 Tax=Rickenella mellea TaxID=50990 RepID=A0A4Y7Q2M6_9AGAM|nr:hypothetical protein BD410DRAFT_840292 [Rickenella mellea]
MRKSHPLALRSPPPHNDAIGNNDGRDNGTSDEMEGADEMDIADHTRTVNESGDLGEFEGDYMPMDDEYQAEIDYEMYDGHEHGTPTIANSPHLSSGESSDNGDTGEASDEEEYPIPHASRRESRDPPRRHFKTTYHERMNGVPCDQNGVDLPPGSPTPPANNADLSSDDWSPFQNRVEFETAEFLYKRVQMSAKNIDTLMDLWGATLSQHDDEAPYANHKDMYNVIDHTKLGEVPWQSFTVKYKGPKPDHNVPPWMEDEHTVWFRDPHGVVKKMLANPDFKDEFDYAPLCEEDDNGKRRWKNFMSGDWVWNQAVEFIPCVLEDLMTLFMFQDIICGDPATEGSMLVPIIIGSDKTTVSVATGQNDFYPVYLSIGNVHNNVRRAHRNAVSVIAFLSMPKTDRKYASDPTFVKFRRQLFHSSLSTILASLRRGMTKPEVVRCPDGHFRRAIYDLACYIADYPEQALLANIVSGWCPKCAAMPIELDGGGLPRSREHTELVVKNLELGVLWNEYGLVGDIIVLRIKNRNGGDMFAPGEPHLRPRERINMIQNMIEDYLKRQKERDHHWEDGVDNPYQTRSVPFTERLFKEISPLATSAAALAPSQPLADRVIRAPRHFRLWVGRGGRMHLDRRLHVAPSTHVLDNYIRAEPLFPKRLDGLDKAELDEHAARVSERWKFDPDTVMANGDVGTDKEDRILLMTSSQSQIMRHQMRFLQDNDHAYLTTDPRLFLPDGNNYSMATMVMVDNRAWSSLHVRQWDGTQQHSKASSFAGTTFTTSTSSSTPTSASNTLSVSTITKRGAPGKPRPRRSPRR